MRAEPALRTAPEVVGEPDRRHRRNGRHRQPDSRTDERQAEPAVVDGLRPAREQRDRPAGGRGARTRAGRARSRGARGRARSPRPRGRHGRRRSSSCVSTPKPIATGNTAERARAVRWRCPESGSRGASPQRSLISERAAVFASPRPPPTRAANAAIVSSASDSTSGRRSPRRSASQSRSGPGSSCRSASVSAWPLPRRASLITRAPASSARSAVASREPSSATTIAASGNCARSALDRPADPALLVTRRDEHREPVRVDRRVVHPCGWDGRDRRQHAVVGRLRDAVAARLGAGEEQHEPEPAGRGVDRVDGREARQRERGNGARRRARRFGADGGHARSREAAVHAGEKRLRPPSLRLGRPDDDDGIGRRRRRALAFLDDDLAERIPERRLPAGGELLRQGVAEIADVIRARGSGGRPDRRAGRPGSPQCRAAR